jgi:hypothetical protein
MKYLASVGTSQWALVFDEAAAGFDAVSFSFRMA